ncbi:MAG: DUF3592 domain-containing protein [Pseudomonadota bacterium]
MDDAGIWLKIAVYLALGVLPWAFAGLGAWLIWSAHRFQAKARLVQATVSAVHEQISAPRSNDNTRIITSYRPVFSYTDTNGDVQQVETFLNSTAYNLEPGAEREILVTNEEPGMARLPGLLLYCFGAIFISGGLVFGIICLMALIAL